MVPADRLFGVAPCAAVALLAQERAAASRGVR
jgi:hypothetical protein